MKRALPGWTNAWLAMAVAWATLGEPVATLCCVVMAIYNEARSSNG